jgi:hypothetical protein
LKKNKKKREEAEKRKADKENKRIEEMKLIKET